MPVPIEAIVAGTSLNETENLLDNMKRGMLVRHRELKRFWRPLNLRQDYWMNMYLMLDVIQQSKPLGVARRFVSNDPHTAIDAAQSILTRNPTSWRIPFENTLDENSEQRRTIGNIENTLEGLIYDLDELFSMRLQMPFWKQITFQALMRGMIWAKVHITTEALKYRRSPVIGEVYESRNVFPHVDQWGLNQVMIEKNTNLGDLIASYPGVYDDFLTRNDYDPNTPALKLEFWSNDRGDRQGINAVLASVGTPVATSSFTAQIVGDTMGADARWLVPPYYHGYTYDELPVIGVPVNGAHLTHKPAILSPLEQRLQERADLLSMEALAWHGPASWVAEIGRSLLASVEEQVPQYNEVIATIWQHLSIGTYGTWIFKTPTGELPDFEPGIESRVALTPQESVERVEPTPISSDAYRLAEILKEEKERGTLSSILMASGPLPSTGVLHQQIAHAALNSLEPFQTGITQFGVRVGTSILAQMQKAGPAIGRLDLQTMVPKKSFWRVDFDPRTDLDKERHYRPVPILKPALPDDLTVRMTAARMALDPRRPLLSLMTVLETILQVDDPMAEVDRIWEDLAQQDPIIILEQMAMALERLGETEMAARIRDQEFAAKFQEDMRLRQMTGNVPGREGFQVPGPEAGPLPMSTQRDGSEQNLPPGMEGAGTVGQRVSV